MNGQAINEEDLRNGSAITPFIEQVEKTDIYRWRLRDERGCQTWHYLETDQETEAWPQSIADRYFLGLPLVCSNCLLEECCDLRLNSGSTRPPSIKNANRLSPKCSLILLATTAPTRQLGLRIWRSNVPLARPRMHLVCHTNANTQASCHRDETVSLRETEPG